jgi:opacity protein-like surface antigen
MPSARSLLVITFLAASALTAAAQDVAAVPKPADTLPHYNAIGYYGFNAGGGLFEMPEQDAVNAAGQLVKMPWDVPGAAHSSHGFGAALTLRAHRTFAVEFDVNYTPAFSGSAIGHGPDIPQANGTFRIESQKELLTDLLTVSASGILGPWLRAGSGRLRPYVAFGAGILRSDVRAFTRAATDTYPFITFVDSGQHDTRTLGIVDVGGGALWHFTPRLGVRGDVRYRLGLTEPEGMNSMWSYVRTTIGLTVAF